LAGSSANTVDDKTIKAGIKDISIALNSFDVFMVTRGSLLYSNLASSYCWLIICVLYSTPGRVDLILA